MSKDARTIAARGLTASDRGAVIEFYDIYEQPHKVKITDVKYDGSSSTLVSYEKIESLPNNLEVRIWD